VVNCILLNAVLQRGPRRPAKPKEEAAPDSAAEEGARMSDDLLHLLIGLLILAGGAFVLFRGETTSRRGEKLTGDTARFAGILLILAGLAYLAIKLVFKVPLKLPW
jgi:hypothetical protein